jgi:hypothetical protein
MNTDWSEWHDAPARPSSGLGDRLAAVRVQIGRRLDATAPDPVRAISACAADGRDLLGFLRSVRTPTGSPPPSSRTTSPSPAARARLPDYAARVDGRQADSPQSDVYASAVPGSPPSAVTLSGGRCASASVR